MPDQKTREQQQADVQIAPKSPQVDTLSDPIAREEMSDTMGIEWDRKLANNDGAAPSTADGLSKNPLALGLLSALDETLDNEKNEEDVTHIKGLLHELQLKIRQLAHLSAEEQTAAMASIRPLIATCSEAIDQVQSTGLSTEASLFESLLERFDALSVDPLA